ncbi:hypothetical protein CO229_02455 [Mycoplasmopsis bovirhinis]|uniref:PfkB family carbohydrate kinase n=1 Tax=Mycoplasmopsis bovirhinis TaxID=29553 RepID=UPI000C05ADD1|nr:PfkB family carbohydrate kinase [Mycoplasmopsis bovirhinis]ATO30965.1 hypothetical protein CO229_02455 [Mycoplasmopsis bovirhinis]
MKVLKPSNFNDKQRKLDQIKQQNLGKTYVYSDEILPKLSAKFKQAKGDVYFNKLHLSSYSGLLNDPNNFVYHNNTYYIFYQWNPFNPIHANKHQGYFTTKNFLDFKFEGLGLRPSNKYDASGIYSGSAFSEGNNLYLYYTGNVKKDNLYKVLENTSNTMFAKFNDDWKVTEASKKLLFEVDKTKYTRHFRDPFIVKNKHTYYLLHGAQNLDLKGKIVVYSSVNPDSDFTWAGEIKFINAPKELEEAFMLECPNFARIDDKDVIFISTQGSYFYHKDNQNRDMSIYLLGLMDWDNLSFNVESWDLLDLGFDFYAPQILNNSNDKKLTSIAWAGTPDTDSVATFEKNYAHSLTLPRNYWIKDNKLYSKYIKEFEQLFGNFEAISTKVTKLTQRQNLIYLNPKNKKWSFEFNNSKRDNLKFSYNEGILTIDRTNMSFSFAPNYPNIITRAIKEIKSLTIIQDASLLEIYLNDGEYVLTTKYFITGTVNLTLNREFYGYTRKIENLNINWGERAKILVPGEALYDEYHFANQKIEVQVGGAALNVAAAIQAQEQNTIFTGTIGNDDNFAILNSFDKAKLTKDYLFLSKDKPTTKAIVTLDQTGERSFKFLRAADADLDYQLVKNLNFDALVLTSATAFLGGKLYNSYLQLVKKAKKENKKIFFDPNYRKALYQDNLEVFLAKAKEFLNYADFIKLSEEELFLITNTKSLEQSFKVLENYWNKLFLITLGSHGTLVYKDKRYFIVESKKVRQVDSTGAGDAFFGTFIGKWFEVKNANLKEIVIDENLINIIFDANLVAGYVVTKVGARSLPSSNYDFKVKAARKRLLKRFKEEFINVSKNN